ncbi:hypothetical protein HZS_5590 [Henneguya salminicola]|nr:hypothetical protein HZS_5590 [Henneguya salminicola]
MDQDRCDEICALLKQTFSSDHNKIKAAERSLALLSSPTDFSVELLRIIFEKHVEIELKISASIALKNHIQRNWPENDQDETALQENIRNEIKLRIFDCYLSCPKQIRAQILHVIITIASRDFPDNWPLLLPKMVQTLSIFNFDTTVATLKLAATLFDRYRFEFESQTLWTEIKYVLEIFAEPLTVLFKHLINEFHKMNPDLILLSLTQLKDVIRIFHCLTAQEFPEFFEDHLDEWFSSFLVLLKLNLNCLSQSNKKIIIKLDKVKAKIIQVGTMFIHKYSEDIQSFTNSLIETVWQLSVTSFREDTLDELVSECINFMRVAFSKTSMATLFEQKDSLINLCTHIIVPNIMVQPHDEERFEDDPDDYVRLELEGDVGSRRHSTCDFVSALSYTYEDLLVPTFLEFVSQLITKYNENPTSGWKYKDAAIRIIIAITNKFGAIKFGTVQISRFLEINNVFKDMILHDILNPLTHPILLACCIKFMINFRKILDEKLINDNLAKFCFLLSHRSLVIQYLSCVFFEDIFLPPNHSLALIRLNLITDQLPAIYSHLVALIRPSSQHTCEISLKCLISMLLHTHSHSKPYLSTILEAFSSTLNIINTISLKPPYLHYLYEGLCLCLRMIYIHLPQGFPDLSSQFLTRIPQLIEQDISNSCDYLIQITSTIISRYCPFQMPEVKSLYYRVLSPESWEGDTDHIYSSTLLMSAFMKAISMYVISNNDYQMFINAFTKLSQNSKHDAVVFNILKSLVLYLPWSSQTPFPVNIFDVIFYRLTRCKKPKFISGFCDFIYIFLTKFSASYFYDIIEKIQPSIIRRIIEGLLLPELDSPIPLYRKKCISIATAQLLFSIPQLISADPYGWAANVIRLLSFNLPTEPLVPPETEKYYIALGNTDSDLIPHFEHHYDVGISLIKFARNSLDQHSQILNVQAYVIEMLNQLIPSLDKQVLSLLDDKIPIKTKSTY